MKIKIKSWEELEKNRKLNEFGDIMPSKEHDCYFAKEMKNLCGNVLNLNESQEESFNKRREFTLSDLYIEQWSIESWMFDIVEEDSDQGDMPDLNTMLIDYFDEMDRGLSSELLVNYFKRYLKQRGYSIIKL